MHGLDVPVVPNQCSRGSFTSEFNNILGKSGELLICHTDLLLVNYLDRNEYSIFSNCPFSVFGFIFKNCFMCMSVLPA